ncbi:MAG TPA: hypothetical protein VF432_11765 [Thermoanaerobaculia bacterium]
MTTITDRLRHLCYSCACMCMFSRRVERVSDTSIYARVTGNHQILIYEMRLRSETPVAMVLPLPTRRENEDAVSFIDLSGYATFFDDMRRCFSSPFTLSRKRPVAAAAGGILRVHRVGAFDASVVPSIGDFVRVDPRFRLPDDVWASVPGYDDYSFAVFQLASGEARVHPMAMRFETRRPDAIYFPTTHVHDGLVHPTAGFDHVLYAQFAAKTFGWKRSEIAPREVMDFGGVLKRDRTRGTVEPDIPISRRVLKGQLSNGDIWLRAARAAG